MRIFTAKFRDRKREIPSYDWQMSHLRCCEIKSVSFDFNKCIPDEVKYDSFELRGCLINDRHENETGRIL